MSEENQQQSIPEVPQEVVTPVKKKSIQNKGALENLPREVKDDMEDFIRAKNPSAACDYIKKKYGEQFPALRGINKASFYQYATRHNVKIAKELALQNKSAVTSPELLGVIDSITDPSISLQDKRAALTALYNACEETSKMLQQRQTNFLDPQIEALILANRKQMCIIIEKVAVLNDQLTKESDKDWLVEVEILVQVVVAAVVTAYKMEHPDQSKYTIFMSRLTENLTNLIKAYKSTKENLKTKKENLNIS